MDICSRLTGKAPMCCGERMVDMALGSLVQRAYSRFRDYVLPGYVVSGDEVRWNTSPAPQFKFTVTSSKDTTKRRSVDWVSLRIWRSTHGNEWELHVKGKDGKVSTGRMIGPGPTVGSSAEQLAIVETAAAKLIASLVNNEIAKMAE